MALIEARCLCKTYPSGEERLRVLRDVSFSVMPGEFVAVTGPSGSGKSTLLNLIGLLDRPSQGELLFDGEDMAAISNDRQSALRGSRIGFIFQAYNLLSRSTALENVELPLTYAGFPKRERQKRAMAMLEGVGLAHRIRHWPAQLSGGEQQRVAIARAMVTNPALTLADEPTGALDSQSGAAVLALLQTMNDHGKTIVLVTHDEKVSQHAKRVLELADGKLVSDTPVADRTVVAGTFGGLTRSVP
ncbi:MAG: ABC transporter ATP-binding protein [Chloroflexota bacterium]|jgi:putative ABC transport system ATP-binding protein